MGYGSSGAGDHDRDRMNLNEKKKLMLKMKRMKDNLEKKLFEFKTLCGVDGCLIFLEPSSSEIQRTLPEKPSDVVKVLKPYVDGGMGKGKRKFGLDEKPIKIKKEKIEFDDKKQMNCLRPEFQSLKERIKGFSMESLMEFERKLESGLAGIQEKESNLMCNGSAVVDDDKKKKGKLIEDDDRMVVVNPSSMLLGFDHTDDGQPWVLPDHRDGPSTSTNSHGSVMNGSSSLLGFDRMVLPISSSAYNSGFRNCITMMLNYDDDDEFQIPPLDEDLHASVSIFDDTPISYDPTMTMNCSRVDDDNNVIKTVGLLQRDGKNLEHEYCVM